MTCWDSLRQCLASFAVKAVRQNRQLQAARARQRNRFSESSGGIGRKWTNMADRHVLEGAAGRGLTTEKADD